MRDPSIELDETKVALDFANLACERKDKEIERLKALVCQECGGAGGVDSGGETPWGAPIMLPCPSCSGEPERQRLAAYEALLEQVPHEIVAVSSIGRRIRHLGPSKSCVACAYEKLKGAQ